MSLNNFIDLQKKVTGQTPEQPANAPTVDHSTDAGIALEIAKRQAQAPKPEPPKIPSAGAPPVPN